MSFSRINRRVFHPYYLKFAAVLLAFVWSMGAVQAYAATKYLIDHDFFDSTGSDPPPIPSYIASPTTQSYLSTTPFDGFVVTITASDGVTAYSNKVLNPTLLNYNTISSILQPMSTITYPINKQNFVMVSLASLPGGYPDYFDDAGWNIVANNFATVAQAAQANGLVGILFDNECYPGYNACMFNYPQDVKNASTYTLAQYIAEARLRGQQVMQAMVAKFPNIKVMTLHGPYVSEPLAPHPPLPDYCIASNGICTDNQLEGPFFVGMTEGMGSSSMNIDGGELYDFSTTSDFSTAYQWRKYTIASNGVNSYNIPSADRSTWSSKVSVGQGVSDRHFNGTNYTISGLANNITLALEQTDQYVWFYPEQYSYLNQTGSGAAPAAWVDAIAQAKAAALTQAVWFAAPASNATVSGTAVPVTATTSPSSGVNYVSFYIDGTLKWTTIAPFTFNWDTTSYTNAVHTLSVTAFTSTSSSTATELVTVNNMASDTTPPSVPYGLAATASSASQINLTWTASTDPDNTASQIAYKIFRNGTLVGTTATGITSYSDTGLAANTSYSYTVSAFDPSGNTSAQSASVAALTQANLASIAYVRGASGYSNANLVSTESAFFNSQTKAGDTIIVWARWGNTSSATLSDYSGNTYQSLGSKVSSGNGASIQMFYATNIKGGSDEVTLNLSSPSSRVGLFVYEYSGISSVSPIDSQSYRVDTGTPDSGSVTTSGSGDLLFAGSTSDNGDVSAWSAQNPYILGNTDSRIASEYAVLPQGTYDSNLTASGGLSYITELAAFRPASLADAGSSNTIANNTAQSMQSTTITATMFSNTTDLLQYLKNYLQGLESQFSN
jgi:hypothetical protein